MNVLNNRELKFTDLTLLAICSARCHPELTSLINFCRMLQQIGVDLIEINADIIQQIGVLPTDIDFLFRICSRDDVALVLEHPVRNCIIGEEFLVDTESMRKLASHNLHITLEVKVDSARLVAYPPWSANLSYLDSIRIIDVNRITSLQYMKDFIAICHDRGKNVDLCADNLYYSATAITVDAIINGIDSVTCSFLGYGGSNGYAALEEVLMAIRIIMGAGSQDLSRLPQLSRLMTDMTDISIANNKPVAGSNIFKYESGIHADGIKNNPATYEPFEPAWVGQNRYMAIGKHSGRNSVISKLNELNIGFQITDIPNILDRVREKSIILRRDLNDEEIKQIGKWFYEYSYC